MTKTVNSHNSQGFAHIGLVIVVLVVLAAVAFGGWYVWQENREDDNRAGDTNSMGQNSNEEQHEEEVQDQTYTYPTGEWNKFVSDALGFTFQYPKDWGDIDVRSDGSDGFFLAVFSNPTGSWGSSDTYHRAATIELRGNSATKTSDSHGEFSKGFYKKDGGYFQVGGNDGDVRIDDDKVVYYYDQNGLQTLLIKHKNLAAYEVLELIVNLENEKVLGLDLTLLHPKVDQFEGPAYSQNDIETMKQIAASFKEP